MNLELIFPHSQVLSYLTLRSPFSEYNRALEFAQARRYSQAHVLLERLTHDPLDVRLKHRVYELYGDMIYLSSGSSDDVKKLYILAYDALPNTRLIQKIALLSHTGMTENPSSQIPQSQTGMTATGSQSASGQSLLKISLQSLEQSESEKQKYLYPINGIPQSDTERLSDIRAFLDSGAERVDW